MHALPVRLLCFCCLQEDADPSDWCVYRNEVHHTSKEKSVVLQVGAACPCCLPACRAGQVFLLGGASEGCCWHRVMSRPDGKECKPVMRCVCRVAVCTNAGANAGANAAPLPPLRSPLRQDVRSDPTLPRTRDVRCPTCAHNEAVFFTASTEEGMTLFFSCSSCGHRWRDYV